MRPNPISVFHHRLVRLRSHSSSRWPSYQDRKIYTSSSRRNIIPCIQCSCMQDLLNLGSSMIEIVRGGYKPESVVNGMSVIPRKRWPGPPFVARRGEDFVIHSLIVTGLYYKGLSYWSECPRSSWDPGLVVAQWPAMFLQDGRAYPWRSILSISLKATC
jgi:hypothetical protein